MRVCGINDSFLWKDLIYPSGCVISVLRDDIKYHCIFFCFLNEIQQNNANACTDLCIYLQIRSHFLFFSLINCIVQSGTDITRSNCIWFLHTAQQWLKQNIYQSWHSPKTPHASPSRANYGVCIVMILEKIDHVITAPHCISFDMTPRNHQQITCSSGRFGLLRVLIRWMWTKWPTLYTRHFQMHFYEWKILYFDSNFSEVCS